MNTNILTKENILNKIDLQDAFNHYLQPYHNKGILEHGKLISNPFLGEKQKTPSFNIYKAKSGNWKYKDFATGDEGDIFNLVMQLKQCDFREALIMINQDFSLNFSYESPKISFEIQLKETWQSEDLKYWLPYGIKESILKYFRVSAIQNYTRINTPGKPNSFNSSSQNPIYGYKI